MTRLCQVLVLALIVVGLSFAAPTDSAKPDAKSPDKEVSTRAKAALERLRETVPEERQKARPEDVIHTREGGVLIGRVSNAALKAKTDNFGEMSFKLANLRSIHSAAMQESEAT